RSLFIIQHDSTSQSIPTLSRQWEPLSYPLLFPHGTLGWGLPVSEQGLSDRWLRSDDTDTIGSQLWYYRVRLLRDEPRFHIFGRLTNEYLVDMFSRNLECRLAYIRQNQIRLRQQDALLMGAESVPDTENIYLPSSFLGSTRWASAQIEDSLAIAARHGAPTFFITFTGNPDWPEICQRLRPGQTWTDLPVVVVRVFHARFRAFLSALRSMFPSAGKVVYIIHSVEFQKRGNPHAHVLIRYEHGDTLTPDDIDRIISAEVPAHPQDATIIQRFMIHRHRLHTDNGSHVHMTSYCPTAHQTTIAPNGRICYRRCGREDAWVVPHCLPLLRKFECHINFEVASTSHIFQYIFKYIHKGPDTTIYTARHVSDSPQQPIDEIDDFWNARYLSAGEAAWRILGYRVATKDPAVTALPVHLPTTNSYVSPHRQYIRCNNTESDMSLLDRYFARPSGTFCDHHNTLRHFDNILYTEYFELFCLTKFDATSPAKANHFLEQNSDSTSSHPMHVILRAASACHTTRLHSLLKPHSEAFYVRTLLLHRPARSFSQLRTVDGVEYLSFQEAAYALHLFADENEAQHAMNEAVESLRTP
ncbi:hypothetical protein FISHEDRAFT_12425, partial [Fistulina hepatica ATCC 64428]